MSPLALPDPHVNLGGTLDASGVQRNFERLSKLGFSLRRANADTTIDTTATPIPNCSMTVGEAGVYFALSVFDFQFTAGAGGVFGVGDLQVNGVSPAGQAVVASVDIFLRGTYPQMWLVSCPAAAVVRLVATRIGTRTVTVFSTHTALAIYGPL